MSATKNILILGGTGYAGSALAREAVLRGHSVTAVSRSAPAAPVDGVQYVSADALADDIDLGAAQVVIGALSPRAENAGTLLKSYRRLMDKTRAAGARLVLVGGFSCLRRGGRPGGVSSAAGVARLGCNQAPNRPQCPGLCLRSCGRHFRRKNRGGGAQLPARPQPDRGQHRGQNDLGGHRTGACLTAVL